MQHWIRLAIQPNILVEQLSLLVEMSDCSYMPNLVAVLAGNAVGNLREIRQVTVSSTARECVLVTGLTEVGGWVGGPLQVSRGNWIDYDYCIIVIYEENEPFVQELIFQ